MHFRLDYALHKKLLLINLFRFRSYFIKINFCKLSFYFYFFLSYIWLYMLLEKVNEENFVLAGHGLSVELCLLCHTLRVIWTLFPPKKKQKQKLNKQNLRLSSVNVSRKQASPYPLQKVFGVSHLPLGISTLFLYKF